MEIKFMTHKCICPFGYSSTKSKTLFITSRKLSKTNKSDICCSYCSEDYFEALPINCNYPKCLKKNNSNIFQQTKVTLINRIF